MHRRAKVRLIALVILSLLIVSAAEVQNPFHHSGWQKKSPAQTIALSSVIVPPDYYEDLAIGPLANGSVIIFQTSSNTSISTALMNSTQFDSFNNSQGSIDNAVFDQNSTSVNKTLKLLEGVYYLVLYANFATANVSYGYQLFPNTPYQFGELVPPQPTGITSFGLLNYSGAVVPYKISTFQIDGVADITKFRAINTSASLVNDTVGGATLQLNTILLANEEDNTQRVYWAQNTPDFVTTASDLSLADNIWNLTDASFSLNNQSVSSSSGGSVSGADVSGSKGFNYGYQSANFTYDLPLRFELLLNESVILNQGILVQMGILFQQNGTEPIALHGVTWFDNVTIHDGEISNASFYVSGNQSTPTGSFYDTEFVFGGEGNGESTNFTEMSATLGLYYMNSDGISTFPSYYSFGGDTAESADNLHVDYTNNGTVAVSNGVPNYVYVSPEVPFNSTLSNTSAGSGQNLSQTASSLISPSSSNVHSSVITKQATAVELSIVGVIAVVLVLLFFFFLRKGRKRTELFQNYSLNP